MADNPAIFIDAHVAVVMLARDCERALRQNLCRWMSLKPTYHRLDLYAYENDSADKTTSVLHEFGVTFASERLYRKKWKSVRSSARANHMGEYRERAREFMFAHARPDYVVVFDPDVRRFDIKNVFVNRAWPHLWSASNGLRRDKHGWVQCDAWAYRERDYKPMCFHEVKHRIHKVPHKLKSAFGGLAIYPCDVYAQGSYLGNDCEHVNLHKSIGLEGYIDPAQTVNY